MLFEEQRQFDPPAGRSSAAGGFAGSGGFRFSDRRLREVEPGFRFSDRVPGGVACRAASEPNCWAIWRAFLVAEVELGVGGGPSARHSGIQC
jgi:hypothetical protein